MKEKPITLGRLLFGDDSEFGLTGRVIEVTLLGILALTVIAYFYHSYLLRH